MIFSSDFFSRCLPSLTSLPLDQYDIWLAEHGANDIPSRIQKFTQDFKNGDGQSLEQLIRVVLSKNPTVVIIFPEILVNIINNGKISNCHQEQKFQEKISNDLAYHYNISAIVKLNHVPCSRYHNISKLPRHQQLKISKLYLKVIDGKLDPHPSEYVHKIMGEFLLYYFMREVEKYYEKGHNEAKMMPNEPFKLLPDPLYNGTILLEKYYQFHCIPVRQSSFATISTNTTNTTSLSFKNLKLPIPLICNNNNNNLFRIFPLVTLRLCPHCQPNTQLAVHYQFKLEKFKNLKIDSTSYIELPHNGYHTTLIQPLHRLTNNDTCITASGYKYLEMTNLVIEIVQLITAKSNYEIDIIYLVIGFQCCDLESPT